jgi:hypothetical protein
VGALAQLALISADVVSTISTAHDLAPLDTMANLATVLVLSGQLPGRRHLLVWAVAGQGCGCSGRIVAALGACLQGCVLLKQSATVTVMLARRIVWASVHGV